MGILSRLLLALALCLGTGAVHAAAGAPPLLPGDELVRERLRAFVDEARGAPGVVVGLYDANGPRLYAHGKARAWRRAQINPAARFEIGSISKGFNGLLLAEMIGRGEVRADQPIGELVPGDFALAPELAAITLEELATHHSGLPRLPLGIALRGISDPYRGTTPEGLLRTLARQSPERVGARRGEFGYSNLGPAVLGQLLARRAQRPWEALLQERVLEPLGIADAGFLTDGRPRDVVQGHRGGRAVGGWTMAAYAPSGGLVMPAASLLELGQRLLEGHPDFVAEAVRPRRSFGASGETQSGLGWFHDDIGGHRFIWHNGGMAGASSFLGVVPEHGWVVVVLANGDGDVNDLAAQLVDPGQLPAASAGRWIKPLLTLLGSIGLPLLLLHGLRRMKAGSLDRVRALESVLSAGIFAGVLMQLGDWSRIPFALWWVAGLASLPLAATLLWRSRNTPWLLPGRWRYWRWLGLAFAALVVALVLWQLLL